MRLQRLAAFDTGMSTAGEYGPGQAALADQPRLLVTKLHPPAIRDWILRRERVVARLQSGSRSKLTLVAAPAGYGKSTALASWREVEAARKPVGWLTLDTADDDPVVLWSHAIEALHQVFPTLRERSAPLLLGSASIVDVVLPRLVNELSEYDEMALVLEDFHRLSPGPSRESVAWFVEHAPSTFQVVVSTRIEPELPLAGLRAHGDLLEVRATDLGFTTDEAEDFLDGLLGLGLGRDDIVRLVERTEGWPAGIYLAALSLRNVDDKAAFVRSFGATNRHVLDFLVDEVLEAHDPELRELMLRSSILERFCGSLCDALLEEGDGAAEVLHTLARTNLFLIPLDDRDEWYRFHHLFGQLLHGELESREPGLGATLHRRAYAWHRDYGTAGEAIEHALAAGAFGEAAEIIAASWIDYVNLSRFSTVLGWLGRLPDEVTASDARLPLIKAWVLLLTGQRDEAAPVLAAIEQLEPQDLGPLPDGFSSFESSVTMLKAVFPGGNVGDQLRSARRATELEEPGSRLWPIACWAMGWGHYFRGELDDADRWFAEAAELAPASGQWICIGSSLAFRSLAAGDRGLAEEQQLLAEEARAAGREYGLFDIDGEIHLALAAVLTVQGRPEEAVPLLDRGVSVLRSWGERIDLAHGLLRQASVLRGLGQRELTASALAEARSIVEACPDAGVLPGQLESLERSRRPRSESAELSDRELTVLRMLSGDLSERDIGRELYLSHNTIHSHAKSIYRKLGASSRSEAVAEARRMGIL